MKKPVTIGELMRVQMRVSEQNNSRTRRALLRIAAGQVGRRGVSASEAAAPWKKTQAECKIWQTKKSYADGISQVAGKDGRNIHFKHGSFGYTSELVEHTLLNSSMYYGGRDDYIEPSTTQTYSETSSILVKSSREDVSDGGSPRGNWWQGSFYYRNTIVGMEMHLPSIY